MLVFFQCLHDTDKVLENLRFCLRHAVLNASRSDLALKLAVPDRWNQ